MSKEKKWRISPESIKRVSQNMMDKKIDFENSNFNGTVTVRTQINGKNYDREFTEQEINNTYGKSLRKFKVIS